MKKRFKTLMVCLTATALLAACGGKSGNSEGESNETKTLDRPFVYVAQQVVGSIDPAKVIDETEIIAAVNLYDPLFYPDVENDKMDPVPHLATEYEVSDDGLVYTIKLRDDVTFHSGNAFTADDVVYTIQRMIAIGEGNSWLWNGVLNPENVKKIDDYTVEFTLNNAYAPFISSMTQLFIVDSKLLQENTKADDYGQGYLESKEAGSGPYTLTKWDRESELDYKSYEDYWKGWEDNQFKDIQMKIITEEATVKTLLASGQADMVHQWLNISAYKEFEGNDKLVVQKDPSAKLQHIPMNMQKAPTDDENVRKAIASAFDYNTANKDILGDSTQAVGPVPIVVTGNNPDATVYQQDLEKAKEYLADSKYAGQDLSVDFMIMGENPEQRQYGQLVSDNLAKIGIKVNIINATWPQITEAATSAEKTPNLTLISDSLKYPHVDSHTYGIYHPSTQGSFRSMSWYDDQETTEVLEAARKEIDNDKQLELYKEAQKLITEKAPSIYVANPTHHIAYANYVEGYKFVGLMGYDIAFYNLNMK
ncbi:ABC transporter substrate-binding protein [Enterococcus saccharolyticus]|uniref:ABC transporter substrate-binding protein n=1 Tax=Enterococcus saccharolyticus TaxID=41997 RepID=UPI001E559DF3|nr:ABC transporter substrate-binding protein [Enterococcus saccharolyticus]MCD5001662.1 ABC transporter substrate-binding protein [Enterococcus saccharolyticus]